MDDSFVFPVSRCHHLVPKEGYTCNITHAKTLLVSQFHLEVVSLSPDHGELRQQQPVDPPAHPDEGRVLARDRLVALENKPWSDQSPV